MVLFQNCVWWSRPLTKIAAGLENIFFSDKETQMIGKILITYQLGINTRASQEPVIAHLDQSCFQ
jgi:hypothetical protein